MQAGTLEVPPSVQERGGYPKPLFQVTGRKVLVYQDDAEYKGIVVPKQYEGRIKPRTGTIIQIGDGYLSHDPDWRNWECPYKLGDRVLWSMYEDKVVKIDVEPGWWTEEEEAEFAQQIRPDKKVPFVILEVDLLLGIVL